MKAGWEVKPLGELCRFENGDRGKNYPGRKAFVATGVPFVNAGHLSEGALDVTEMNYIPRDHFERLGSGKIQNGDLLFCLRGSLGKHALVDSLDEGAIASSLVIVRPGQSLYARFLSFYFASRLCADEISKYANGAAQPNLSAKSLAAFKIPLPPLEEQQRIVAILDEAFEGLDRARANAEANLADAQHMIGRGLDLMLNELGDRNGHIAISQIASVKGGKRLPKGYKLSPTITPFPYISVKDLTDEGTVSLEQMGYVSEKVQKAIARYTISKHDVYVSIAGTIGKSGIVPDKLDGANLTENAAKLVLAKGWIPKYVYWCTRSAHFAAQATAQTRTAAQPKLALQRLGAITIPLADPNEQRELAQKLDVLRDTATELSVAYTKKLQDLADLRQSLLQKAFAGELT